MNIALFASSFYPNIGGVEELVHQLAREYAARGHRPIIVTNRWPSDLRAVEAHDGTPVYRFPMRGWGGPFAARVRYRASRRAVVARMLRVLRQHGTELVHVQCVSTNGHYARIAAHKLRLPLVVTSQGERTMDATHSFERSPFLNATLRELLARGDYLTACSRHTLDDLERWFGSPFGDRARVVYNGIALDDFDDASVAPHRHPRPYVLGIGRLVPQKGFDVLMRAFAVAVARPSFQHDLLIAGEGPERPRLEASAHELRLDGRVHLLGGAPRPIAISLFKGCDIFALPSRREPFGIVNLEAMAARRAVVASAVGGVPEIVRHEGNGLLVEEDNVESLAQALARLGADATLRARLAGVGREVAEKFAWPRIAEQYHEIYRRVLRGVRD